ncbi:hypothetical protein CDAR_198381 [Caerostris darwini]|uniref:Uncharacterized protein n=1 Tax=Caerostris darwini TaxID=1538125 RepID=A0AAV4W5J3_9ARAC|nr:hypothetical protein CDAR_198381 [Caerostris darwini]
MNIDHDHSFYCQTMNQMDTNTEGNGPSQDPPQVLSPQVSEVPSPPADKENIMSFLARFRKEDIVALASELGDQIPPNAKMVDLKKLITKLPEFEEILLKN